MSNRELYRSRDDIKVPRWKKIIAGLTATAALYPLSACGNNETTEASNDKPVATATANQEKQSNPQTPEDYVGIANNSFAGLNVQAPPEVVEQAKQPVPGSLSPEEGAIEIGRRLNVLKNSASFQDDSGWLESDESPESRDIRDSIRSAIFTDNGVGHFEDENSYRIWLLQTFEYMKAVYPKKTATYQNVWDIDNIKKISDNTWVATGWSRVVTNFDDIERDSVKEIDGWDEFASDGIPLTVTITNEDGFWRAIDINSTS